MFHYQVFNYKIFTLICQCFTVKHIKLHQIFFFLFLLTLPFQTRVIFAPELAYIGSTFNYHLAYILYLSDLLFLLTLFDWVLFHKPTNVPPAFAKASAGRRATWIGSILVFFAVILATLFHVKHLNLGLYNAVKWAELLLLVIYIWLTFREKWMFHVTLMLIFVSGIIQAFIGLWQFHVQHGLNLRFFGE